MSSTTGVELWPSPREVTWGEGSLDTYPARCFVVGEGGSYAAEVLAARLGLKIGEAASPGCVEIRLTVDPAAEFAEGLARDQRPEAYRLSVGTDTVTIVAAEPEGLLRGAATLLQLADHDGQTLSLHRVSITDYPAFRFRCASDWLLNVECNRWSYDWGDGIEATRARVERKLDMCFEYKINQVWFDGFGWDVERTPHYAELARHLTGYARRRGIGLTFAGYGGGYGTSYQKSEIYRSGYHGEVFANRRPYPHGEEYLCCGLPEAPESRSYGTCPSNDAMQAAKLAEMGRFVSTVQPAFMYIHDIDTGNLSDSHEAWLARCDECRRRWPSDEMADPRGQAGAIAAWYRRMREHLNGVPVEGDYCPKRDLTLIFASPVYTHRHEPGQPDVWQREVEYFGVLSSLVGEARGVEFALREQLLEPDGEARILQLRRALDEVGCGHGVHVISFAGGDHYQTDDMVNASAALVPMFQGAESVCLSNGGVHEEPIQLINADTLWRGGDSPLARRPTQAAEADALFEAIVAGTYRPAEMFAEGGMLDRACRRLWGDDAGAHMYRAYLSGEGAARPVSRVWWAVTREMRRLKGDPVGHGWTWESVREEWTGRVKATGEALDHARKALEVNADSDIEWFARSLEVGGRFAAALVICTELKLEDSAENRARLAGALGVLQAYIEGEFEFTFTDVLGGDPGCWRETIDLLREVMLGE